MSITICVATGLLIMLYMAGTPKWFVILFVLAFVAAVVLIIIEPYRIKRLTAFSISRIPKPRDTSLYSRIMRWEAGIFLVWGYFEAVKISVFAVCGERFHFSVIGESLGFLDVFYNGGLCGFIFSGIKSLRAECLYHTLLATGIIGIIGLQTLVNMAVVTGAIPPTGLPLPFISAGGTALMTYMFVSGVLINIASPKPKSNHKM